jgi:lysophospholipase L1-like esterase
VTARYLALGDSYTIGEGVAPADRWPVQLAASLRSRGISIREPVIVARTGWTTAELLAALDAMPNDPGRDFDIVSLLIGVNDQYRALELNTFLTGLDQLVSRAIEYAGGRPGQVLLVSIPDWGVTPFARRYWRSAREIAAEIDVFNDTVRARALSCGARFADVTSVSRRAASEPELLASDGLHPSALMYAEWVRILLPEAAAMLSAS